MAYPNRGFHRARQSFLLKVDYAVGLSRFDQLETSRRTCDVPGPRPTRSKKSPISRRKRAPSSQPWQLQTAEAQFSEVFRRARERTPQVVTRQDKEAVVIVAIEEFERLTHRAAQSKSLAKFFADSPLAGSGIDLERKPDCGRPVDL